MRISFHKLLAAVLMTAMLVACKKDKDNSNVPNQQVDIYIYPDDPQYATTLGVVNGWVYITGATKGIIVFRQSNTDFVAYDRCCPYDPNANSVLKVHSDLTVRDTLCGSKFLIFDGSINQGPAAKPLKAYACNYDGNVLHIYN